MPRYAYIAVNAQGERIPGEVEAGNPDDVFAQLTVRGLRIEQVHPAPAPEDLSTDNGPVERLNVADSRELGGHIAEIISCDVPMEGGLAAIAEELPHGRIRRSLRGIVRELETGTDLETVLERRRAPAYLAALIRAGQRTGRTAEILEAFISHGRVVSEMKQAVWAALVYPLALLLVVVPLVLFLFLWIVPTFAEIFDDFEISLPVFTEILVRFSGLLSSPKGKMVLVLTGLALVALAGLYFWAASDARVRRTIGAVPIVGSLVRWMALARFSQLLSLMIESRIPLDEAIVLAGDAAGDGALRADSRKIAQHVQAGQTLASAARETGCLPPSFIRALSWERHAEGFVEVLESTADIYASRARVLLALVLAILPPLVVVFVAMLVGCVVFAVFMPLIDLLRRLS